jgi:hypothetical protein
MSVNDVMVQWADDFVAQLVVRRYDYSFDQG